MGYIVKYQDRYFHQGADLEGGVEIFNVKQNKNKLERLKIYTDAGKKTDALPNAAENGTTGRRL